MPVTSSIDGKTVTIFIAGHFSVDDDTEFHQAYQVGNQGNSYVIDLREAEHIKDASLLLSAMFLLLDHAGGDQADIIVNDPPARFLACWSLPNFRSCMKAYSCLFHTNRYRTRR